MTSSSEKHEGDSCSRRLQDFINCLNKIIWVQLSVHRSWWCSVRWEAPLHSASTRSSEVHRSPVRDILCTRAIPCLCPIGQWCYLRLLHHLLQLFLRAVSPRAIRTTRSRAYPAASAPAWRRAWRSHPRWWPRYPAASPPRHRSSTRTQRRKLSSQSIHAMFDKSQEIRLDGEDGKTFPTKDSATLPSFHDSQSVHSSTGETKSKLFTVVFSAHSE